MTVDDFIVRVAQQLRAVSDGEAAGNPWKHLSPAMLEYWVTLAKQHLMALSAMGLPAETLAALASGTWKAAPVSPTEEMRRSGNKVQVGNWYRHIECSEHGTEYVPHCDECNNAPVINTLLGDSSADVFKAMLAAAPANPEKENDR